MKLTAQQIAFINALCNTTSNIALIARAGCGKTTTIAEAVAEYLKAFPAHEVTVCVFAKKNQTDAEAKLQARGLTNWKQVQAATSHSMGWGLVRFALRLDKKAIDDKKVRNIIDARAESGDAVCRDFGSQINDLVHHAKLDGFGFFDDSQIGDASAWYRLADHYSINGFDDTTVMDAVIKAAQNVYRISLADTKTVDFDDMILFPLVKNIAVKFQRDLIVLDEAQDTSRARRAMLRKFLKPTGRMVIVGDDRQAIMGFAGASTNALDELIEEFRPTIMPLNVTWRCPKNVVAEAQRLVPDIQAAESAIDGKVESMDAMPETFNPTDAILCRNTAPLVTNAYALIKKGVACKVEGREIGTGLLKMVDRWKRVSTIPAWMDKLEDYRQRETQKAAAKGKDSKIDEINDRCDTLVAICEAVRAKGRNDLQGIREFINDLFADDVKGVLTLCTYHRSKGREWPRVMLLEHAKRCPSPRAKKDWELQQEANLAYVAITRAQEHLIYLNLK